PIMYTSITSVSTKPQEKKSMLNLYLRQRDFCLLVQNFLNTLLDTDQFTIINDQDKPSFSQILAEEVKQIKEVNIIVPTYLSEYLKEWLHREITEIVDYPFVLNVTVNTALVGGLILQTDKFFFEDTVQSSLANLEPKVSTFVHQLSAQYMDQEKQLNAQRGSHVTP
ncbi:MAG TPA: F0F1 ATP synthase subunit delta, partial [bacterium]|nr:F0F1 ATP synthase subunit delta [bacterium]